MSPLDLVFLVLLAGTAWAGYQSGAVRQGVGVLGVIVGALVGAVVGLAIAGRLLSGGAAAAIAVTCFAAAAVGGYAVGRRLGDRLAKDQAVITHERADRAGGAGLAAAALLVAIWFLATGWLEGPSPALAGALRDSITIRTLALLPESPFGPSSLTAMATRLHLPDPLVGAPPIPAPPVPAPDGTTVETASKAGLAGTVEVLGEGCFIGKYNAGAGFVAAPGYVVTNAHVIAGTHDAFVWDGTRHPADVVLVDTALDVAILHAPSLRIASMPMQTAEQPRGTGGAVVGYPNNQHRAAGAAVMRVLDVLGRDIYGDTAVTRRMYELQAPVVPGNSGGPFVLGDGSVAGLVFGGSVLDPGVSYAITAATLAQLVAEARTRTAAVPTGPCP